MNQMPEPVPVGTVAVAGPDGKMIPVPAVVWPVFRGVPAVMVVGSPQHWQQLQRAGVTGQAPSPASSEVLRSSPINHDPITLRRTLLEPGAGEWAMRVSGIVIGCPRCGRASVVRCPGQIIDERGFISPTFVCECGLHCGLQLGGFTCREDQCPTCGDDKHPFLPCTQFKEGHGMCNCLHGLWEAPQEDGWPPAREAHCATCAIGPNGNRACSADGEDLAGCGEENGWDNSNHPLAVRL